ncbi:ATP-binding protein [Haloplanus aerogenes]|uniref:histidine kinase n=1 Tax=Haloplanus aerogenes TaxID=660522 RepID=A0A3M0DH89_9EURY|nr:PAS domain-containing sensor histidine kinase [Haloplanus aerogenes]AZH26061.1 PAS domain S-box protein [Haloplanus aerogenes]RMB18489.1 PAS domain S-box-containing protein [Haloplanus aerogenes]
MPETRRTLHNALDALDDIFYIYDEHGRLVFWNDHLNELFDLTDEQIEGMMPAEFFLDADQPAVERAVERIFDDGETVVEARADTTNGRIRFELTGRKLTDDDGSVLGFCGIGRNVTERREWERQLAAQNDRLTEFATILAHDLRNPLAVAKGYLDRYLAEGETVDIDRVTDSLDRIERIVEDVLTVAIEGQAVTDVQPVALDAVARDAWEMVAINGATLDVRTSLVVDADATRVRRFFENLFRNSVEHGSTGSRTESDDAIEHGGADVTVTVRETDTGFAVVDDGPGIPVAERDHVFDPGFSRTTNGTGFGLYIVQTIAEAHGWAVAVTEGDAGGAQFEFATMPVMSLDADETS